MGFETMYKEFENTKDVSLFYDKYSNGSISTRFLLIRSLDNKNLDDLYFELTNQHFEKVSPEDRYKTIFDSSISNDRILDYIEEKRAEIIQKRTAENEGLDLLVQEFGSVTCGLRNDKVDDIIKGFVRDKTIKEYAVFREKLDNEILQRIQNYVEWSFYNQITNDLIEMYFIQHPKIIPTLRKIHHIDFFIKLDNKIIPFDLKITHISDSFFDLYTKGIEDNDGDDDFKIREDHKSEIEIIKDFYKRFKKDYNLPAYGSLSKIEIIQILEDIRKLPEVDNFLINLYGERKYNVKAISRELKKLEWWNYKYQGERLFSNNNRIFIFLAYLDSFEDGRPLKGKLKEIGQAIHDLLDELTEEKIHKIKYVYEKEPDLNGKYCTYCLSTLIKDNKA